MQICHICSGICFLTIAKLQISQILPVQQMIKEIWKGSIFGLLVVCLFGFHAGGCTPFLYRWANNQILENR